jgi:hypothetical protein
MSDNRIPPGTGRSRDLVRKRRPAPADDTGRRHHLGVVPPAMPVLGADGSVGSTRTNAVQLTALHTAELTRLATTIDGEMEAAARDQQFERAAGLRDERAAVAAEIARRTG